MGFLLFLIKKIKTNISIFYYLIKLFKYRTAGVKEYWIVNPMKETVQTYFFEGNEDSMQYSFEDEIPVSIYSGFLIRISELLA